MQQIYFFSDSERDNEYVGLINPWNICEQSDRIIFIIIKNPKFVQVWKSKIQFLKTNYQTVCCDVFKTPDAENRAPSSYKENDTSAKILRSATKNPINSF